MDSIIEVLVLPLGYLMKICYELLGNYGLAIIAFTFICKIILLPLGVWLHRNSIKMIKMQPKINMIKVNCFGDKDRIAEEQARLFKEEKYNPLASVIPLAAQIIILMGLIQVIYNPFTYLFSLPEEMSNGFVSAACEIGGLDPSSSSVQLSALNIIQDSQYTEEFLKIAHPGYDTAKVIDEIKSLDMNFLGFNLSWVPVKVRGTAFLLPVIAGFSAWLLCMAQNKSNVLQSEQGKLNKYGTMALSVGISLYLGLLVPAGVVLYWILSNLIAIIQMYSLNAIISPKKYIDYAALAESRKQLSALENLDGKKKLFSKDPDSRREKEDYKKFFSIVNKHIVFYSEKSGFYKYFQNIIEELLRLSNVKIHYITSDPDDKIFELAKKEPRIKPYYIGEKRLITLFMKMEADIVIMTTPDLDNFYLKRSYLKKDIEYVYVFHGMTSTNMCMRKGAYDHFDTLLCVGQHQIDEIRETEKMYQLPAKNLIPCGYGMLDNLLKAYEAQEQQAAGARKRILIAPSWQEGNILETCIDDLISKLYCDEYSIILRPHPEFIKRYPAKINGIVERHKGRNPELFKTELDFSSNSTIFTADLLITDWSGIAHEFSYTTKKPVLFINTPMKVLNPEYINYENQPLDITLRNQLGISIETNETDKAPKAVKELLSNREEYKNRITDIVNQYVFNIGKSGQVAAKYILNRLKEKSQTRGNE